MSYKDDLGWIRIDSAVLCTFYAAIYDGLNSIKGSEIINAYYNSFSFILCSSNDIKGVSWFLILITLDLKK